MVLGRLVGKPGPDVVGDIANCPRSDLTDVSADVKMSEIAEIELTHLRAEASSTGNPWRCCREIVEGGRSERDIRDEGCGVLDAGDSPEAGHCSKHGASVPECTRGDGAHSAEASASKLDPYIASTSTGGLPRDWRTA